MNRGFSRVTVMGDCGRTVAATGDQEVKDGDVTVRFTFEPK